MQNRIMQAINALDRLSSRSRFTTAIALALAADALQIFVFPFFAEGALSPADDILDIAVATILVRLLGWHWEFVPAFAVELVPGLDLVPFWTLAVVNVYRKFKQNSANHETRDTEQVIAKAKDRQARCAAHRRPPTIREDTGSCAHQRR